MISEYLSTVRGFNRSVLFYLFAMAMMGFAIDGGVYSVVFNLYLLRLGFGPQFIGQINAAGLFTFALLCLPAGWLGARFGSRRMMLAGLILMASGSWLLPSGESVTSWLAPWLLATYVIFYFGMALFWVNSTPFLMEITAPGQRSHAFSVQAALVSLAAFAGSLIGGFLPGFFAGLLGVGLDEPAPYRLPLFTVAFLLLPAIAAVMAARSSQPSSRPHSGAPRPTLRRALLSRVAAVGASVLSLIVVLTAVRFFGVASMAAGSTFFNVYMDTVLQTSTVQIGLLSALGRLAAVPAALVTPVLVARWGVQRTIVWSSSIAGLGLLPMAFIPHWIAAGLGLVGMIAFSSIRYPALLAYSMELTPSEWRAVVSGTGEMAAGFSFACMALLGGYIIAGYGFTALFLTGAGLTMVGTLIFWLYFRTSAEKRVATAIA